MEIGHLRHRITLQKRQTETNSNGFTVETWVNLKTVWAAVSNLQGREYFAAAVVQSENTVKFLIRYAKEFDTTLRILFRGKRYNIISIDNKKYQNKYLEIKAQEVMADED